MRVVVTSGPDLDGHRIDDLGDALPSIASTEHGDARRVVSALKNLRLAGIF